MRENVRFIASKKVASFRKCQLHQMGTEAEIEKRRDRGYCAKCAFRPRGLSEYNCRRCIHANPMANRCMFLWEKGIAIQQKRAVLDSVNNLRDATGVKAIMKALTEIEQLMADMVI